MHIIAVFCTHSVVGNSFSFGQREDREWLIKKQGFENKTNTFRQQRRTQQQEKRPNTARQHRNREKERRDSGRRHKQWPIEDQSKPDRPSCKEPLNHRETTTEKVSNTEQKYHGTHGGVLHVLLCVRRNAWSMCVCVFVRVFVFCECF